MISAAGIMWYSSNSPRNQLIKQYNMFLLDSSGGKKLSEVMREFRDDNNTIDDAIRILLYCNPKESLPVIRKLLKDRNPEVRASAINALAGMRDEESLPVIRELLKDKNTGAKITAITALSGIRDKESIPEIRKHLNDEDAGVRTTSIYALSQMGDKESAPEIRRFLNDKNEWLRNAAINAIIEFKDRESIPLLKELLKHDGVDMIYAATLEQLGVPYEEIAELKWKGPVTKADIVKLRQQLHNKNLSIQHNALYWIIKLNDKESIPDLIILISEASDFESRLGALTTLGLWEAKEAIPQIKELLKDKEEWMRKEAEVTLKKLGVSDSEIQKAKEGK